MTQQTPSRPEEKRISANLALGVILGGLVLATIALLAVTLKKRSEFYETQRETAPAQAPDHEDAVDPGGA